MKTLIRIGLALLFFHQLSLCGVAQSGIVAAYAATVTQHAIGGAGDSDTAFDGRSGSFVIPADGPQILGPTSLPSGAVGLPYPAPTGGGVTFTSSGGANPKTWSATGLPSGLSIDRNTGVLGGTPAFGTFGNYRPQFTITDANNASASVTLLLTINPPIGPLIIGPLSLPAGTVGMPYPPPNGGGVTFTSTGAVNLVTWSATGLPNGLTINSATGVLGGTPAAGTRGNYLPQFTVTDANNHSGSVTLPLTINLTGPLQILGPTSLPDGTVGIAYPPPNGGGVTFTSSGGTNPLVWSATGLPNGLSINGASGVLGGIPTAGSQGNYLPQFTVKDANNLSTTVTLTLKINPPSGPQITGPTFLPGGTVGIPYPSPFGGGVAFTSTGGMNPQAWSAVGLPNGLSINRISGVLSGIPAAGSQGNYRPQFTVTDVNNVSTSVTFNLTISPSSGIRIISPTSLPAGTEAVSYPPPDGGGVTFTATGGANPLTWSATGLPEGLSINNTTGVLGGIPAVGSQGFYSPQFTVTDAHNLSTSVTLAFTINPANVVFFPQTAVGHGWDTLFGATNIGATASTGTLSLFDQHGMPLMVNGTLTDSSGSVHTMSAASSFTFTIPPGGTIYLSVTALDPNSPTQSGWARLGSTGGSVTASATYEYVVGSSTQTLVGVLQSQPLQFMTIPVDIDTAQRKELVYAISNPGDQTIVVKLALVRQDGSVMDDTVSVTLGPGEQVARYLSKDLALTQFKGSLVLRGQGGATFIAVGLLQKELLFTVVPLIPGKAPGVPD